MRPSSAKPLSLAHRGVVRAQGFLIDSRLLGEATARRRVLAHWSPGARVHPVTGGYVLLLAEPRHVASDAAPGLLITAHGHGLTTVPLTPDEARAHVLEAGSLLRVVGGVARVEPLLTAVDPASWLELSIYRAVEVRSLGAPPPPAALALEPQEAPSRQDFGSAVPPRSAESRTILASLAPKGTAESGAGRPVVHERSGFGAWLGRLFGRGSAESGPRSTGGSSRPGGLRGLLAWFARRNAAGGELQSTTRAVRVQRPGVLGSLLRRLLAGWSSPANTRGSQAAPSTAQAPAPSPLWNWLMRGLHATRMARLLGFRQAAFVRRMLDAFERGDLEEALRHAIPLGGPEAAHARPLLGLPAPRSSLSLSPQRTAATTFMALESVEDLLRRTYRDAFQRLEREGRIEEAAFVLADLLHSDEEAVAFLERHGKLRLAAELAEGRKLNPGLVVRLWLLAGEVERAVLLARQTGAFASAVALLQAKHPDHARSLRLQWGDALAEAGDWGGAVRAVWPVTEARGLLEAWLTRGIAEGPVSAARLLPLQLRCLPEKRAETRMAMRDLMDREDEEGAELRLILARALVEEEADASLEPAARDLARALLRDGQERPEARELLSKVLGRARDGLLKVDLPPAPVLAPAIPLARRSIAMEWTVSLEEAGELPIHDLAPLGNGRVLVALGEAGVRIVQRAGRTVASFAAPAMHLVLADHGTRALALIPRDHQVHVTRLELDSRRVSEGWRAPLRTWADSYDGQGWFAAEEDRLLLVDALSDRYRALWQLPKIRFHGQGLFRTRASMTLLVTETTGAENAIGVPLELWRYELPSLALRDRWSVQDAVESWPEETFMSGLMANAEGCVVIGTFNRETGEGHLRFVAPAAKGGPSILTMAVGRPRRLLAMDGTLVAVDFSTEKGRTLELLDLAEQKVRARLHLEGAVRTRARFTADALWIGDDRGRLLRVELATGLLTRLTVSA